ncbi:transmembrane protein, putative (macronuclear) [Tetrahymena thermophila SB210]|uniref:Transmembrane protein, putative n=1 Tax=Tetrahymena thermophila (strain SB210) TaxID=312017 RepID=W7XHW5_TETTS|nr:transmembrane protein, putative [Tetrahymena thermophila SB210]EWS74111.1 transmembrane protein, putative [Tetrahymena thermophila SB210]|eukprot:XP_012653366.1 transmembrane protein, putative [Tetrahymena thermophila SB210]
MKVLINYLEISLFYSYLFIFLIYFGFIIEKYLINNFVGDFIYFHFNQIIRIFTKIIIAIAFVEKEVYLLIQFVNFLKSQTNLNFVRLSYYQLTRYQHQFTIKFHFKKCLLQQTKIKYQNYLTNSLYLLLLIQLLYQKSNYQKFVPLNILHCYLLVLEKENINFIDLAFESKKHQLFQAIRKIQYLYLSFANQEFQMLQGQLLEFQLNYFLVNQEIIIHLDQNLCQIKFNQYILYHFSFINQVIVMVFFTNYMSSVYFDKFPNQLSHYDQVKFNFNILLIVLKFMQCLLTQKDFFQCYSKASAHYFNLSWDQQYQVLTKGQCEDVVIFEYRFSFSYCFLPRNFKNFYLYYQVATSQMYIIQRISFFEDDFYYSMLMMAE